MFQEFRTQNRTHAYLITVLLPIWVYAYAVFFKFFKYLTVFSKALSDVFPVIAMQRFDFKSSIIAIKLYLMLLNLFNLRIISK